MSNFDGRKVVSIKMACKTVGVSRRTIYNWIKQGKIEYIRTTGGSVRIFVNTLWRPEEKKKDEPKTPLV